jgi:hypothetical protein
VSWRFHIPCPRHTPILVQQLPQHILLQTRDKRAEDSRGDDILQQHQAVLLEATAYCCHLGWLDATFVRTAEAEGIGLAMHQRCHDTQAAAVGAAGAGCQCVWTFLACCCLGPKQASSTRSALDRAAMHAGRQQGHRGRSRRTRQGY